MSERALGIEHPNTIQKYVRSHPWLTSTTLLDICILIVCLLYILILSLSLSISLSLCVCVCARAPLVFLSDALGPVLFCQWPAVHCPEAAVPRTLPHADGVWGRPPGDGSS